MAMILYNVKHRGPYEYDKFILNTFQISNEIRLLLNEVKESSDKSLESNLTKLDITIEQLTGINSISHKLLLFKMETEE